MHLKSLPAIRALLTLTLFASLQAAFGQIWRWNDGTVSALGLASFPPNGAFFSDGNSIWDVASNRKLASQGIMGLSLDGQFEAKNEWYTYPGGSSDPYQWVQIVDTYTQNIVADSAHLDPYYYLLVSAGFLPNDEGFLLLITNGSQGRIDSYDMGGNQLFSSAYVNDYPQSFSISPKSDVCAIVGSLNDVYLLHLSDGTQYATCTGHTGQIVSAQFESDSVLCTASQDGTVRQWNVQTGVQIGSSINLGYPADAMTLSPDGKTIAVSFNGGEIQTESLSGTILATSPSVLNSSLTSLQYSADGKTIFASGKGSYIQKFSSPKLTSSFGPAYGSATQDCICWNVPGTELLTGDTTNDLLSYWDATDGHLVSTRSIGSPVLSVAESANGNYLADGTKSWIDLTNNVNDRSSRLTSTGMGATTALAFSSDSTTLVSAQTDKACRVWQVSTGALKAKMLVYETVASIAVSSSLAPKQYIATGDVNGRIILWDAATYKVSKPIANLGVPVSRMVFTADGKYLLAQGKNDLYVYNASTGAFVQSIAISTSSLVDFDVAKDSSSVFVADSSGFLDYFDLQAPSTVMSTRIGTATSLRCSPSADGLALTSNQPHDSNYYGTGFAVLENPFSALVASFAPDTFASFGGYRTTVRGSLVGPARPQGLTVYLSSNSSYLQVPASSITIAPGDDYFEFEVYAFPTVSPQVGVVRGICNGIASYFPIEILPPTLSAVSLQNGTVTGGKSTSATVLLSAPAPSGGLVISLNSSLSGVSVPSTVTVLAGADSVSFNIGTSKVTSAQVASVTATLNRQSESSFLLVSP